MTERVYRPISLKEVRPRINLNPSAPHAEVLPSRLALLTRASEIIRADFHE